MSSARLCYGIVLAVLFSAVAAPAQKHRDPLTPSEIDQVRNASWEPKDRLALYLQFARARLAKLEEMRVDPKITDRPRQTHDLLDDFQLLYDELNDNVETYVDRKDDIRKPLKLIIDADTEFQAKLRALKDAADVKPAEYREYEFVLTNLIDTIDSSVDDHKQLLADQEDAAKHKKLNPAANAKNGGRPE